MLHLEHPPQRGYGRLAPSEIPKIKSPNKLVAIRPTPATPAMQHVLVKVPNLYPGPIREADPPSCQCQGGERLTSKNSYHLSFHLSVSQCKATQSTPSCALLPSGSTWQSITNRGGPPVGSSRTPTLGCSSCEVLSLSTTERKAFSKDFGPSEAWNETSYKRA